MKRLKDNISSAYLEAANKLNSKKARRKIVAYVESYDDVLFWRYVLAPLEDETRFFEVMLPSHEVLQRGKKSVLMNLFDGKVGRDMIACVDADYDYLIQGATHSSQFIINNPYVFHTYAYAIENFQCYAPSLHSVCVMVTLNDHAIFDFERYMRLYSQACYPLFVWSIWAYRSGEYPHFSLSDFNQVVDPGRFNIYELDAAMSHLQSKVDKRVRALERHYPKAKQDIHDLKEELQRLGVTPETTYLYIQGHHIFDVVTVPIVNKVCSRLRMERENEIHATAVHKTQMRNEMSCYESSLADTRSMLKKNFGYAFCPQFRAIQEDIRRFLEKTSN